MKKLLSCIVLFQILSISLVIEPVAPGKPESVEHAYEEILGKETEIFSSAAINNLQTKILSQVEQCISLVYELADAQSPATPKVPEGSMVTQQVSRASSLKLQSLMQDLADQVGSIKTLLNGGYLAQSVPTMNTPVLKLETFIRSNMRKRLKYLGNDGVGLTLLNEQIGAMVQSLQDQLLAAKDIA